MATTSTRGLTAARQDGQAPLVPKPNENTDNLYASPSSSSSGFFQSPPKVENQFFDDVALQRVLALMLPTTARSRLSPELSRFGDVVLTKQVLHWIADAEKNPPYLRTWDTWGKRRDELVTSEGWRNLQDLGIKEGMVAMGYENEYAEHSRLAHFTKYHLWCGSSAWVNCPSLMTDGAARLLAKHVQDPNTTDRLRTVLHSAYQRVISRDTKEAWTTGQWMTERPGGSDVSKTETLATYSPETADPSVTGIEGSELGPWAINGFKWFSSATDSQMTIFLARTKKGVSAFYAPMRRTAPTDTGVENELNGIAIQRLKQKLGTRALPTAELELKGVRAWLLGEEGRGTKEIATILNIARIHNAVTAVGFWGRGLGVSRAFARVRKSGDRRLTDVPAHVKTMARQHIDYRANMHFTFFVVALLGMHEYIVDKPSATYPASSKLIPHTKDAEHLLRLLTPAVKGLTAKAAITGLQECMESIGGVGYLENEEMEFNIARIYRDANVLSIWEGTTDMMAHDVYRVIRGKTANKVMAAMERWTESLLRTTPGAPLQSEAATVMSWWQSLSNDFRRLGNDDLQARGREMMERLGYVVSGALLIADALRDSDVVAIELAKQWVAMKAAGRKYNAEGRSWKGELQWDRAIVFGDVPPETARL